MRCSHSNANNNTATFQLSSVGIEVALAAEGTRVQQVQPTIWDEFALRDRVALVSGANRGLGLEMALVLIEAGARAVYCVVRPAGLERVAVAEYVKPMVGTGGGGGAIGICQCGCEGPDGDMEDWGGDWESGGGNGRLCGCWDLEA